MLWYEITLTTLLTVLSGTLVFLVGQFFLKLIFEPFYSLRRTIVKARNLLVFHADNYSNPGTYPRIYRLEASKSLRGIASEIISEIYEVRGYHFFNRLGLLPSRGDLIEVHREFIGLSNSLGDRGALQENLRREGRIARLLN